MKISDNDITRDNIQRLIDRFDEEYGVYDEVLVRLFKNADNSDYDNVFCRVGLLDLIYSTGIQRFNKGGIDTVTRHIRKYYKEIDSIENEESINFTLYDKLKNVDYVDAAFARGQEKQIPVFASKFLSFSYPEVYPIMDSIVKKALGVQENADYKEFYDILMYFIKDIIDPLNESYSLKEIDKFLWMWGKDVLK